MAKANEIIVGVDDPTAWLLRVAGERDEAIARAEKAERERDEAVDCGQVDVCKVPPGCQRHWEERYRELVRERDEALNAALSGEADAVRRAESAELGCEIAYRREPTQEEGDAHEIRLPVDGAAIRLGECFVPMGSWEGRRCHKCRRWEWAQQQAGRWVQDARVLCEPCAKETP